LLRALKENASVTPELTSCVKKEPINELLKQEWLQCKTELCSLKTMLLEIFDVKTSDSLITPTYNKRKK
jgi:lysyl-tRNA synthetase class II